MIYIIEIPHQRPVSAWSRSTEQEIIEVIEQSTARSGDVVLEELTGHEMLDMYGVESTDDFKHEYPELSNVADFIEKSGLYKIYYKSFDEDEFKTDAPDKLKVYLEYNAHDLHTQRVFMNRSEAVEALNSDDYWNFHQGIESRIALEKLLEEE